MARFLAITSRGLLEPLTAELQSLSLKRVKQNSDAVEFDGSWGDMYRVHLSSRLATRILLPVSDFTAYNEEDLYFGVLRRHDFTQYILPNQTLRVESHVREHKNLRDQRFVALKVKDALVDQFRNKFDERPDVGDEERADLRVVVRVVNTQVSLALDLTGEPLSRRGYRNWGGAAPIREHVAAGLVRLSNWDEQQPMVDPFCGSGTILIEAALQASGQYPNRRRRSFAFMKLRNFQQQIWNELSKDNSRRASPPKPILFGYDKDPIAVENARANARAAGVENWILFHQKDVATLQAPTETPGTILTNPPYGERLETKESAKALMTTFAQTMKTQFKGWNSWILSGDPDVITGLKLKAVRRIPIWNGSLECRFLNYPIT